MAVTATLRASSALNGGAVTTGSFTPGAGSLLVACWGGLNLRGGAGALIPAVTDSQTLIWGQRALAGPTANNSVDAGMFTAPVVTSTSMTVTFSLGGGQPPASAWGETHVFVVEINGHNTSSPVGASAASWLNTTTDGAASITLNAAPAATSLILSYMLTDGDVTGTVAVTEGTGYTELGEIGSTATSGYGQCQTNTNQTATSVDWVDVRAGTMVIFSVGAAAIEIKAAGGTSFRTSPTRPAMFKPGSPWIQLKV